MNGGGTGTPNPWAAIARTGGDKSGSSGGIGTGSARANQSGGGAGISGGAANTGGHESGIKSARGAGASNTARGADDERRNRPNPVEHQGGTGSDETASPDPDHPEERTPESVPVEIEVVGLPAEKRKRGRPPGSGKNTPPAKATKPRKKKYSDDKELLERVKQGVLIATDLMDMGFTFGLGVASGVWKHTDDEAELIARILLSRADGGSDAAIRQIEKLTEYGDVAKLAMIEVPRAITTVTAIMEEGIHPPFMAVSPKTKGGVKNGTDRS